MSKFLSIAIFFIILSFFSAHCNIPQSQSNTQVEVNEKVVKSQFDSINKSILAIMFPPVNDLQESTKGSKPKENDLACLREKITKIVSLNHPSLTNILTSQYILFNLLFWAIYSKGKVLHIITKIKHCDIIENIPLSQVENLSRLALDGLELAWHNGFPFDQNLIDQEAQFSRILNLYPDEYSDDHPSE
jgi:hypothetical protein